MRWKSCSVTGRRKSSGTFLAIPGETIELKEKHVATIESLLLKVESPTPSLPGASVPKSSSPAVYKQAEITVSWPIENVGVNFSNLMGTVAGNLFELNEFSGLRLLDIEIPASYLRYL